MYNEETRGGDGECGKEVCNRLSRAGGTGDNDVGEGGGVDLGEGDGFVGGRSRAGGGEEGNFEDAVDGCSLD